MCQLFPSRSLSAERERYFSLIAEGKERESEVGLDNRQIQSINGDVYTHLNTLGYVKRLKMEVVCVCERERERERESYL